MQMIRCPKCEVPLSDAEALRQTCLVCGAPLPTRSVKAPASVRGSNRLLRYSAAALIFLAGVVGGYWLRDVPFLAAEESLPSNPDVALKLQASYWPEPERLTEPPVSDDDRAAQIKELAALTAQLRQDLKAKQKQLDESRAQPDEGDLEARLRKEIDAQKKKAEEMRLREEAARRQIDQTREEGRRNIEQARDEGRRNTEQAREEGRRNTEQAKDEGRRNVEQVRQELQQQKQATQQAKQEMERQKQLAQQAKEEAERQKRAAEDARRNSK